MRHSERIIKIHVGKSVEIDDSKLFQKECSNQFNSCILFCPFFDQKMKSSHKMTPKSPPDGGSFEPIKIFSKIFFTGSLTGSEPENNTFDQPTEDLWVEATSSFYQFLLRISGSL